jgi:hypothetical protein
MMGVDATSLCGRGQRLAAALALALQEPTSLSGRVTGAVGLLPKKSTLILHGGCFPVIPDRECIEIVIRP